MVAIPGALLSLTEQWRKELDNRRIVGLVSMDLSIAFDILPQSLIIQKPAKYGADENTLSLIKDYLLYNNPSYSRILIGSHL